MTIAENVFIGREPGPRIFVNWRRMATETRAADRDGSGSTLKPTTLVRDLSVAEQQMVEIARALVDEVAADRHGRADLGAQSRPRSSKLFRIIRDLKAQGLGVIFVTHRLEEVMELCDRYTVLRDGRQVGSGAIADTTIDGIIRLMVGRDGQRASSPIARPAIPDAVALVGRRPDPPRQRPGPARHGARRTCRFRRAPRRDPRHRRAGRRRPHRDGARHLRRRPASTPAASLIDGEPVVIRSPQDAIRHGIGLVPEDRKQQALFLSLAVRTNLTMAALDRIGTARHLRRRARRASAGRGVPEAR